MVPIPTDNAIHYPFCRSSVAVLIRTERKMPRGSDEKSEGRFEPVTAQIDIPLFCNVRCLAICTNVSYL